MNELKGLVEEGKHIEYVMGIHDLERKISEEKRSNNSAILQKLEDDKNKLLKDAYNKFNNIDIISIEEKKLVDVSCYMGVYLAKKEELNPTQIRKLLNKFDTIESKYKKDEEKFKKEDVIKLKPILAYISAKNKGATELVKSLDNSINKINNFKDFKRICDFIRGVIAYHKLARGD